MKLFGYLSEYSLPEIFSFLHEGRRTGALILSTDNNNSTSPINEYLWFKDGRIIAATAGIDGVELLTKILQRKLMSSLETESIGKKLYQLSEPLGLYLKSQGLLDASQLKLLFNSQTIVPVFKLFEAKNRRFKFEPDRLPLNAELTGINLSARELGLSGLRLLKDWSGLSNKLPDPNYAIQKCHSQQSSFEFNRHELQLWKLADGKTPLTQLAVKMSLSIDSVRQLSFCLITFGALQEIPVHSIQSNNLALDLPVLVTESNHKPLSNFFMGNLKKFLQKGNRT